MVVFLPTYFTTDHFEGSTLATERTPWLWHLWRAETCGRFTNVWCVCNFMHVKLVINELFFLKYLYYNITRNIPTCFGPQWAIIREW